MNPHASPSRPPRVLRRPVHSFAVAALATLVTLAPMASAATAHAADSASTTAAATPSPRATVPTPGASTADAEPSRHLFGREDLWYGLGAVAATLAAATRDRAITDESIESDSRPQRSIARLAQPLGNMALVAPMLALAYGGGRVTGHLGLAGSAVRVGVSIAASAAITQVLKEAFGRARPMESPGQPGNFEPFSSHQSFPSGHTTVAFAAARAIDEEAQSPWVRALVYPAAAAVAWSRVHDREHWTSDVVAGAAIGVWSASKVELVMRPLGHGAPPAHLGLTPLRHGVGLRLGTHF